MKNSPIAFIIDNFSIRAGFIKQVVEQANYFAKNGYDVTVFCSKYDKKNCFPEIPKHFTVKSLQYSPISHFTLPIENRLNKKNLMQKLILSTGVDYQVFIVHGDPYYMLSKFFREKYKRSQLVWHVNDLPYSFDISLRTDVPMSYKLLGPFLRKIDKHYISKFTNVTVLNNEGKRYIKKFFNLSSTVVYTGVEEYFAQKKPDIKEKENWNVLSVGAFATNRRYEDIIYAINILNKSDVGRKYNLTIVGAHKSALKYYFYLKRIVAELRMENTVTFLNSVTNELLKREYLKADIFIQATDHIGWTIPAMEAMISETPCIITNTCGLNESLTNGEHALIVPPRKPNEIAIKIKKLSSDVILYEKLKNNGKRFISDNFMWDKYCLRYKKYIYNLLHE